MNKPSNVRLSLRKLLLATMAVGPIAVLPAPVWAAVPTTQQFTATSGTATYATSGTTIGTITASDKAVLVWNGTNFNIAAGDTINFTLPTGGAVLNKVGYTTTGALGTATDVTIDGTLFSTGRVFVLANGNITVGGTASITTNGGLYLSTLEETSDFSFATVGNLGLTGASRGNVTIGAAGASPTISGNLEAYAGQITSHRAVVSGDVIYRSVTAGAALDISQSGLFQAGGNLTVTTNNGTITGTNAVVGGNQVSGNQTTTLSTGTSGNVAITLNNAGNNFEILAINAPGTNGNVSVVESNIITLAASTVGNNLTVNATGTSDSAAINTSGTVTIGGNGSFNATANNSAISIGNNSTIAGSLSGSTDNAGFTFNGVGNLTVGGTGIVLANTAAGNRNAISITGAGGVVTVGAPLTTSGNGTAGNGNANITVTGGSISTTAAISQTNTPGGMVTLNATTGSVAIGGTVNAERVTVRTAGGSITQSAAITTNNSSTSTSPNANVFNAGTGAITLTSSNNFANNSVIQLTGSSASLTNQGSFWLGTTSVTGGVTLNVTNAAAALQIGAGLGTAGQAINIGGVLTATTNGGLIRDEDYGAQSIAGGLNFTTGGGAVTLDAARQNGALAPVVQFGAVTINSGAGAIDVAETTTLNLATITTTGGLTARSVNGGIVDSGVITSGTASTFTAPNTDAIVLDNSGHNLGTITVSGGNASNSVLVGAGAANTLSGSTSVPALSLTSAAGVALTIGSAAGTASVGNLTVTSGGTLSVAGAISATNLTITGQDTSAASITDTAAGRLVVSGTTTLASSGNITLDSTGHDFATLTFNGVTGNARVDDANNITVNGTASALVDVRSGANNGIGAAWSVVLGNLTAGSLDVRAQDGTGGTGGGISGTITQQSGTTLSILGNTSFTTDGANIVINNSGNNFGRLSAAAGNAGITLRERDTIRLGTVTNNGSNTVITSEFGGIWESTDAGNATRYTTTNGTLTLNAATSILLNGSTRTAGTTDGGSTTIVANAPAGSVNLFSNATNLTLGNITANSFALNHTGNGNLTQSGNTSMKVFGSTSFTSNANMTITSTANNFGRIAIVGNQTASNTRNITITEGGTLNLGSASLAATYGGNITLTSANGDIIDSGLGGLKLGGTVAAPGTGVVSLAASNGNIVLDDPTTDFATTGGIVFNGRNVTLAGLGQTTIWLGANGTTSSAANLTVSSATGSIGNAGNLSVTGTASFQAGAGNITLNQAANQFGSLKFVGNQVAIAQSSSMNVLTGSQAIGPAQLASTNGNITITPAGDGSSVSFGRTASFSASGSITLRNVQAADTVTVNAAGTKDLSALSLAIDLSGKAPTYLGTGVDGRTDTTLAPKP